LEPASPIARIGDLAAIVDAEIRGDPETIVAGIVYDSRTVEGASLFFCVPGETFDGHGFAPNAAEAGASCLVVERWLDVPLPQIRVTSVRAAMGPMSATFFGRPAEQMRTVGFTGTNGKTTSTYLLEAVLDRAGMRAGVIGTTGARIANEPVPVERTTPEAPDLHRLLARMRTDGVKAVAMEISSHALAQHRVDGLRVDVAVFTNLSQDHLDLHGSMEAYFAAKARLFTPGLARAGVVNVDDPWGVRLARAAETPVRTVSVDGRADLTATDVEVGREGSRFTVGSVTYELALPGRFNVANALGVIAAAEGLGIPAGAIAEGLRSVRRVPGRMEPVDAGQAFAVMVDYAHTPDSIQHVLRGARPLVAGRIIVVFGCGGDRDRAKRSPMGLAATSEADLAIITSDNPRSEDPLAIIAQIEAGARRGPGRFEIEPDRRLAIRRAVELATPEDLVLIAGKGHESTQEIGEVAVPFDDVVVAREELERLGGVST
jgi:UDP-N-acetylmuramoyl-L-alanyl-D-glutamate--2,6-diaminopimelate ligase